MTLVPPCPLIRTAEVEPCPGCGATHGVQRITGTSAQIDAWMCECGMHWATTVINPTLTDLYRRGAAPSTPSVDLTGHPVLHDVDGTPIPFTSRVELVAVEEYHGALPARLHTQGEVIGRGTHLVYVRFAHDREMIALRPDLVRVIPD